MNLSLILTDSAERFPEKSALFFNGREISYADLLDRVMRLAGGLQKLGIKKGDRVAIALPNRPEFVIAYFAILHAGGVVVPLNAAATPYELTHYLTDSGAKIFITGSRRAHIWEELKKKVPTRTIIAVDSEEEETSLNRLITSSEPVPKVLVEKNDPAVLIYTSAMNGTPLGAVLSHYNLFTNAEAIRAIEGIDKQDRSIAVIPLFHAFGATVNMLSMIKYGGSMVLMERFETEQFFELLSKSRVTYMAAVPLILMGMLAYPQAGEYDLGALWLSFSGGCPTPPGMVEQFKERFDTDVMDGYGLTEASPVVTSNQINGRMKIGSVGLPIPETTVKIVDDAGKECPCGAIGEVVTSGPGVMLGYFRNPEATSAVLNDGRLHTGDLGYLDEDGFLFLTGRKKHMLITNGLNIYPKEVEKVLRLHPAVEEALVLGKPDPIKCEIAQALVVAKPGHPCNEKDILKFVRSYLAPYKAPRKVTFVEQLPTPNNG
ncbi:MAG: AMP-binding protein [Pseudomonadota bacterium]